MILTYEETKLIEKLRKEKSISEDCNILLRYIPLGETHIQQLINMKPTPIYTVPKVRDLFDTFSDDLYSTFYTIIYEPPGILRIYKNN